MKHLEIAIYVLAAVEFFKAIYLGGKMADGTTALTDLQQLFADLTQAIQNAANEFTALLNAIKNNNGVNPGAIETLVTKGHTLVSNLNDAVAAAQAATNPPVVAITINPTTASVGVGLTQQFTGIVTGATDTSVTYKAGSGSIDANGLYTAPASAGTDVVTATSNADPTKSATANVTITLPFTVAVTISPTTATVPNGTTQQFSATVTGATDTSVKWSAVSGTMDQTGLYTAPAAPGTDVVTALSNADPTKNATASVTVT
jgi:uncharacterized protein YjdB